MYHLRFFLLAVIVALSGCAPTDQYPRRALIEPKQVVAAIEKERQLNERKDLAIPDGEQWFEIIERQAPILLSVPHSTRPLVERVGEK